MVHPSALLFLLFFWWHYLSSIIPVLWLAIQPGRIQATAQHPKKTVSLALQFFSFHVLQPSSNDKRNSPNLIQSDRASFEGFCCFVYLLPGSPRHLQLQLQHGARSWHRSRPGERRSWMGFSDSSTMSLGVDVNSSTLCKSLQTGMKKDDTLIYVDNLEIQ